MPPDETPTLAYRDQPEVDALLDAAFAAYGYTPCVQCGAQLGPDEPCWPCVTGNRRLPLYPRR